jgi:error-prone DNA polymerase
MEALVAERERGGPFRGIAELASRAGAGLVSLERLAWAGALDGIPAEGGEGRRQALWRVGVTGSGHRAGAGTQLALPIEPPRPPRLQPLGDWARLIADYRSVGIALDKHSMELMRPDLDPALLRSTDLGQVADGSEVEVGGMVVARQRPQTAKGIAFLLLEDERGCVNVVVPKHVYERRRLLVRTAVMARVSGRLERREGVVNVLADEVAELERPKAKRAKAPAPPRRTRERAVAELRAVVPPGHSFGRRGR